MGYNLQVTSYRTHRDVSSAIPSQRPRLQALKETALRSLLWSSAQGVLIGAKSCPVSVEMHHGTATQRRPRLREPLPRTQTDEFLIKRFQKRGDGLHSPSPNFDEHSDAARGPSHAVQRGAGSPSNLGFAVS